MFPPLFTPGSSVFSSKQASLPSPPQSLEPRWRRICQNKNDIAAIHQFYCPLLYAVVTETRLTGQTLAKDQLRCVLLHHVFTELLWGHFRPISCWMSERKICWVEWLKVWDNGTVNNQEMGSKRILKRSQASSGRRHQPPAHPPAGPEERTGLGKHQMLISLECAIIGI